jgi:hypothetical protein
MSDTYHLRYSYNRSLMLLAFTKNVFYAVVLISVRKEAKLKGQAPAKGASSVHFYGTSNVW